MRLPTAEELARRCRADGELRLAARYWDGGLRLTVGDEVLGLTATAGELTAGDPGAGPGVIELAGPVEVWAAVLAAVPPPFANDLAPAAALGLERSGDEMAYWQYYPAAQRALELLRDEGSDRATRADERRPPGHLDAPVGRYVHVELDGLDHRIYFEEAGSGVPLLLQHTAGSHGLQWRHLFEVAEITDHFRLIAYDLPFHGKSIPPVGRRWWEEPYRLEGAFLRQVPLAVAGALDLDRPAFMGCSVGGLLALDLARHHPDRFRAVISLEGALAIPGDPTAYTGFWHPQVSNETKARLMNGLMSPTSPEPYRRETTYVYSAGWPPAFVGDLHYYNVDYDLSAEAKAIDTDRVAVHILSGEYDYSGTPERGRAAHDAIAGSTWSRMDGLGHFPMAEDPERFLTHLLPILRTIREEPRS